MTGRRTTVVEIRTDLLEALRALHPGRSDREIVESAVRQYLLGARRPPREPTDALLQALEAAPVDDEPSTESEDRSARDAIVEYRRGLGANSDQIRAELGMGPPD